MEFTVTRYSDAAPIRVVPDALIGEGGEGIAYRATLGGQLVLLKKMKFAASLPLAGLPLAKYIENEVVVQKILNTCVESSQFACFRGFIGPRAFCDTVRVDAQFKFIGDDIYLFYDLIDGSDLFYTIEENRLTKVQKLSVIKQLVTALQILHAAGVVHRDIKPENLMVTPSGQLKIIDFGQTCRRSCNYDMPTGSILYAAPETIGADRRSDQYKMSLSANPFPSDIFSAGLTFFELVTQRHYAQVISGMDDIRPEAVREIIRRIDDQRVNRIPRSLFNDQGMGAYYNLFLAMIRQDPAARPTALEALEELARIEDGPVLLPNVDGGRRRYRKVSAQRTRKDSKKHRRTRSRRS
jgi:serine/threonine protein kinase